MDNAQVTEADRKAAADLIKTFPLSLGWADRDDLPTQLVEAFARHRLERSEPVGCQYPVHGSVTHVRDVECCDFCGHPADTTPPEPVAEIERLVEQIVRDVAELPDRTSPIDWPEAMYVTADELAEIVRAALGDAS